MSKPYIVSTFRNGGLPWTGANGPWHLRLKTLDDALAYTRTFFVATDDAWNRIKLRGTVEIDSQGISRVHVVRPQNNKWWDQFFPLADESGDEFAVIIDREDYYTAIEAGRAFEGNQIRAVVDAAA